MFNEDRDLTHWRTYTKPPAAIATSTAIARSKLSFAACELTNSVAYFVVVVGVETVITTVGTGVGAALFAT